MKITIGGFPGSGTSTVAKIIAKKLNIERINAGHIWDVMASEKNTDVMGLSIIAENDDSIDQELDKRMVNYAKNKENIILEGRLIGALCSQNNIESFKVWLEAPLDIRVGRVCQRESKKFEEMKEKTIIREKSEIGRYLKYYNIDIQDKSYYDLVISSEKLTPIDLSELILNRANKLK